jgi:hypothetical protein
MHFIEGYEVNGSEQQQELQMSEVFRVTPYRALC